MELSSKSCANCSAPIDLTQAVNGVVECSFCHSRFTVAQSSNDQARAFLQIGDHELDVGEFDKAYDAFSKAAELDKNECEAYWGMALAEFQVRYIRDEVKNRLQPICYDVSDKQFSQSFNFKKAIEVATPEQKAEYMQRAEEIEYIHKQFNKLKASGLDYDCFICVKVSDDERVAADGKKMLTADCKIADDIDHELRNKGFKPFFSENVLRDKSGSDYEAHILYALYSSESMLIVCTDERYLQTKWVKNEYMRYMRITQNLGRDNDNIAIVYKGTPISRLPGRTGGEMQGIDVESLSAIERIVNFVGANLSANMRPLDIERKEYSTTSYTRKEATRQGVTKRAMTIAGGAVTVDASEQGMLRTAEDLLTRREYAATLKWCDNLLKNRPLCGRAYWLRFLAQNNCASDYDFMGSSKYIEDFDYLEKALSAIGDQYERSKIYSALEQRVRKRHDLPAYREYIVLPESDDGIIDELTAFMYEYACSKKDESIFDAIINTVKDTDRYIQMNISFARLLPARQAGRYYKNVLEADNGHKEALYCCFEADHGDMFAYCSRQENQQTVTDELYSYGFNEFATKKLFKLCLDNIPSRVQQSLQLFDFLITVIPKSKDKMLLADLHSVIDKLYDNNCSKYAKKYVEYCLTLDNYDDIAFFYRLLINHGYTNPLEIILLGDELIGDSDYFSAISSFTEKNPSGNNFYLDVNSTMNRLRDRLGDMVKPAVSEIYVRRAHLGNCYDDVLKGMTDHAQKLVDELCAKYKSVNLDGLFYVKKDVSNDSDLKEAYEYARVGKNSILENQIHRIISEQGRAVRNRKKANFAEAMQHFGIALPSIICILYALVTIFDPMIPFGVGAERFLSVGVTTTVLGGLALLITSFVMIGKMCDEVNCNIMLRGAMIYIALMVFSMIRTAMMIGSIGG